MGIVIAITVIWLAGAAYYLGNFVGFENVMLMLPHELGGMITGVLTPPFLLWLVVGMLQGNRRIHQGYLALVEQGAEMRRAAELSQRQAKVIADQDAHIRRGAFLRIAELMTDDLVVTAQSIIRLVDDDTVREGLFKRFSLGDRNVYFSRVAYHTVMGRHVKFLETVESKGGGRGLLERFCEGFETLLEECDASGDDGKLRGIYEWAPAGDVYVALCRLIEREATLTTREAQRAS